MGQNTTHLFDIDEFNAEFVRDTLQEVASALEERGYDPVNQMVGYLLSGDPGYISSHKEARNKMTRLDRAKVIEVLLKEFQKDRQCDI